MNQNLILLTILGMAVVTYIPRLLPALILSQRTLPPLVARWLGFIPCTVLAALLTPGLLLSDKGLDIGPGNIFLLAALPTFLVAWRFKSFFGAVAVGMISVALLRAFT